MPSINVSFSDKVSDIYSSEDASDISSSDDESVCNRVVHSFHSQKHLQKIAKRIAYNQYVLRTTDEEIDALIESYLTDIDNISFSSNCI